MEGAALNCLLEPLKRGGGIVSDRIHILAPPGGERGVFVRKQEPADNFNSSDVAIAPLLRIPRSLIITSTVAANSEIVGACCASMERNDTKISESTLIALFIFTEKALGDKSCWKWYLDTLPTSGSGALYFNHEELCALDGTPLRAAAESKQRHLRQQFACFTDPLASWKHAQKIDAPVGFEEFKWANFVVLSRAISLRSFSESGDGYADAHAGCDRALLPALDMFNHSDRPSAFWSVNQDGSVSVYAPETPTGPGVVINGEHLTELHFTYGEKPNTEWLYEHGFIPENNEHDAWPYLIEPSGSAQLMSIKQMWMSELGLLPRVIFADPASTGGGSDGQGSGCYISREAIVALCLAAISDTSDACASAVGTVTLDFPYFIIDGELLIDDDDTLLLVPGLRRFALDMCIGRLQNAMHTMAEKANQLSLISTSAIKAYLLAEFRLLRQVIAALDWLR
ncbi:hypothetical protein LPJ66_005132 [Kickxella alabastrina]|uniref:Uncharacterized protein n=1 Tax=Kickxella alabastrina TaxID=61397 RepID=A0ACC1IJC2_9FUNG|nr:hypothetical protein LPJ66_005132 [Kickxella alabastrina]